MHMASTQGLAVGVSLPAKLALLVDSPRNIYRFEGSQGHVEIYVRMVVTADRCIRVLAEVDNHIGFQVCRDPRHCGTIWGEPSRCHRSQEDKATGALDGAWASEELDGTVLEHGTSYA